MPDPANKTTLLTKIRVQQDSQSAFAEWQSKLHIGIASFPGFVDLEIFSPSLPLQPEWIIIQRFSSVDSLLAWRQSSLYSHSRNELSSLLIKDKASAFHEEEVEDSTIQEGGVTEVFVTKVSPDKIDAYRDWMGKIHQIEVKAPGFRRVFVQAPKGDYGGSWITLLQFDTQQNLDLWLHSPERKAVLNEAEEFIKSLESHRIRSSFSGWFSSVAEEAGVPSVWKQTMLVLLVLFPIVMLEMKYLNPITVGLNPSLATFIGNAISVSLVSWPFMPIVIYALYWWLYPESKSRLWATIGGTVLVLLCYAVEIAVLWHLF